MTSTLEGFAEGLVDFAEKNREVVLLHTDTAASCGVSIFEEKFPERSFNCGVSEQDMILTAAGLSLTGKIPFACSRAASMAPRAFDQIRASLSIPGLSAVLAGTFSGLSAGEDGASQQMNQDIAIMRSLPQMTVLVPADASSAFSMVSLGALNQGPVYIRLGSEKVEAVEAMAGSEMKIGGGRLLREGDGVTICACGIMVHEALKAADILFRQGINAEVLDCFSLKPLPAPLILASLRRTGCCVTAEEHNEVGGLGEAVSALCAKENPVPVRSVAIGDKYGQSGKPPELQEYYGLTFREIVGEAAQVWSMRRR